MQSLEFNPWKVDPALFCFIFRWQSQTSIREEGGGRRGQASRHIEHTGQAADAQRLPDWPKYWATDATCPHGGSQKGILISRVSVHKGQSPISKMTLLLETFIICFCFWKWGKMGTRTNVPTGAGWEIQPGNRGGSKWGKERVGRSWVRARISKWVGRCSIHGSMCLWEHRKHLWTCSQSKHTATLRAQSGKAEAQSSADSEEGTE